MKMKLAVGVTWYAVHSKERVCISVRQAYCVESRSPAGFSYTVTPDLCAGLPHEVLDDRRGLRFRGA